MEQSLTSNSHCIGKENAMFDHEKRYEVHSGKSHYPTRYFDDKEEAIRFYKEEYAFVGGGVWDKEETSPYKWIA